MQKIDPSEFRWTLSQAATLAGYDKLNTLRSYFQRGYFRIMGGEAAKARGFAGLLTLHDVLAIAVAERLIRMGAHPKTSFQAGVEFAHFAEGGPNTPVRQPGGVFSEREHGLTVMVFFPSDGATRIVATHDEMSFNDLFVHPRSGRREPGMHLLLNDVHRAVMLRVDEASI